MIIKPGSVVLVKSIFEATPNTFIRGFVSHIKVERRLVVLATNGRVASTSDLYLDYESCILSVIDYEIAPMLFEQKDWVEYKKHFNNIKALYAI